MFLGQDIKGLVDLLLQRGVSLYHACQFVDFESYLELGGIPSRALLDSEGLPYTPFETDHNDRQNGVWDKVFLNLSDFGEMFASGNSGVPNVYGPIQLQIQPQSLLEADDVAICLRSAGGRDFSRDKEALGKLTDVDRLFERAKTDLFPDNARIKSRSDLAQEFSLQNEYISHPEISCQVARGFLPMKYVIWCFVDPCTIGGSSLLQWVERAAAHKSYLSGRIQERLNIRRDRKPLYDELANVDQQSSLQSLSEGANVSDALRQWARSMMEKGGLDSQFRRFLTYIHKGTIGPLRSREFGRS